MLFIAPKNIFCHRKRKDTIDQERKGDGNGKNMGQNKSIKEFRNF